MGRRLAEATKARRTRRTRGEAVLRFFLARVELEVAGFFLTDVLFAGAVFVGALLGGAV